MSPSWRSVLQDHLQPATSLAAALPLRPLVPRQSAPTLMVSHLPRLLRASLVARSVPIRRATCRRTRSRSSEATAVASAGSGTRTATGGRSTATGALSIAALLGPLTRAVRGRPQLRRARGRPRCWSGSGPPRESRSRPASTWTASHVECLTGARPASADWRSRHRGGGGRRGARHLAACSRRQRLGDAGGVAGGRRGQGQVLLPGRRARAGRHAEGCGHQSRLERLSDYWWESDKQRHYAEWAWKALEAALANVREAAVHALREDPPGEGVVPDLLRKRDEARQDALAELKRSIDETAHATRRSHGWRGGAPRQEFLATALERAKVLDSAVRANIGEELRDLEERKRAACRARKTLRSANYQLENAEDNEDGKPDEDEVRRCQEELRVAKRQVREDGAAYNKCVARLWKLAEQAPEVLIHIADQAEKYLRAELRKLELPQQSEVQTVLDDQRDISHYDQELSSMRVLANRRHEVYATSYEGVRCVLKAFSLHERKGLESFIKEILRHMKLRHPLVVPLKQAFFDLNTNKGFLHFDEYECSLEQRIKKPLSRSSKGASVQAGMPDRLAFARRIVHAMIQSVAHMHTHNVVHGDLNPSNWLWDGGKELPRLIDFETAVEAPTEGVAATSVQSTALHTHGYTAPELTADPRRQRTKESDVYALGRSIEQVLRHRSDCPILSHPERKQLQDLVEAMTRNNPDDRISAAKAVQDWWTSTSSADSLVVACDELEHTQSCISDHFTARGDSRPEPISNLIDAVVENPELPLNDERLVMDVVRRGGEMKCLDNRRLYCFKEAQGRLRGPKVFVRIRLWDYSHVWTRYEDRLRRNPDVQPGERRIQVRRCRRTHVRGRY
ncbi:unnamed protein product [Prorocentrum cordatum]|uniref:Protein kinase domain-containing protein n=1 Tax=Prorocentrum cordatum TaxID=2364126 RepID=A0ABN9WX76_9DINO|nr:unnamed protein product [Polarella glacialis]